MKTSKFFFLCILAMVIITIAACSTNDISQNATYNNLEITIDSSSQTISHNNDTYYYKLSNNQIDIIYPNNATYFTTFHNNAPSSGWSDDYDDSRYIPGHILVDMLGYNSARVNNSTNPLVIVLLISLGLWNVISPNTSWYLSYGWKYKNAEPSEAALVFARLGGIVAIIIGVILIFV